MKQPNPKITELRQKVINFLSAWHKGFIIDYWWRKKYGVAFGSKEHREMNFIDMLIEYQEELNVKLARERAERIENDIPDSEPMTQREIDDEYENLDLEQFNNN